VATAYLLTSRRIKLDRVARRLTRAGYAVAASGDAWRVSPPGDGDLVEVAAATPRDMPVLITDPATQLLGWMPRDGLRCAFAGPIGRAGDTGAWATVVAIAKAVAAEVPLAVFDDGLGTSYLVHPGHGLISTAEIGKPRPNPAADLIRRILGG
jgi:hypothetical protein